MTKTRLYARESVAFDHVLTIRDEAGDAIDITGWTFSCALTRQNGSTDIPLAAAAISGAEGFEVVDGPAGELRLVIAQATLAGVSDTTGDFTLFGDLLGTPDGGEAKFAGDLRLNVTDAGADFPGNDYGVTVAGSAAILVQQLQPLVDEVNAAAAGVESTVASVESLLTFPPGHPVLFDRITDPYVFGPGVVPGKIYFLKGFDNNIFGTPKRAFQSWAEANPDGSSERLVAVFNDTTGPHSGVESLIVPPTGNSGIYVASRTDWGAPDAFATAGTYADAALPVQRVRSGSLDALVRDIVDDDRLNKAFTAKVHSREPWVFQDGKINLLQPPSATYNLFVVNGQSLAAGNETWPALSTANYLGNLQYGGNVLPQLLASATFFQHTPTGLQPLVAQSVAGGSKYSAAQEAAFSPGNEAIGEPVNHGWVNSFKARLNKHLTVENDPRIFVTTNVATPGQPIGALKKTHSVGSIENYGQYLDVLSQIDAAVGASDWVVSGIVWMQGEFDQTTTYGSLDATKASYKATFGQLVTDMQNDAKAATGQTKLPPVFTYQPAPSGVVDVDKDGLPGQHIGMALLETSLERSSVFLVGPIYPVTDKGTHLDSNGSRWFGDMIAKVQDHVILKRKDWQPLRAIAIKRAGPRAILVHYHVPAPPLAFGTPYKLNAAHSPANQGFYVKDTGGTVPISKVTIVSDTTIRIDLTRDMAAADADVRIWYAGQQTAGYGMVRDSDQATADDPYTYSAGSGMYASANLGLLANKPYPLQNWSVGFSYTLGQDER